MADFSKFSLIFKLQPLQYHTLLETPHILLETSIGNSKKIWSNIDCILGKKHSLINTTIKLDGIRVAEPETIANAFNSYFNNIAITLSDNINNNLTAFESYLDDQIPE